MAAATLTPEHTPDGGALAALAPLPWSLDVSCPVAIPPARAPRGATEPQWPFGIAGPSTAPHETLDAYVTRRYYEALYLGETLFPLSGLVSDLERASTSHSDELGSVLARLILPLSAIETRHRRTLAPVLGALLGSGTSSASRAALDDAINRAALSPHERDALSAAVALRASSRAVTEGARALVARTLAQELEQREVLIQIILLLVFRALPGDAPAPAPAPVTAPAPEVPRPNKRRRKVRASPPPPPAPTSDPAAALELLADRVSVWLAIGELGIGAEPAQVFSKGKGKAREDEGVAGVVGRFWDTVLVAHFLPKEASFLTAFHLKVFGKPIAPELVPAKKRRKPEVTHRLSLDEPRRGVRASASKGEKPRRSLSRSSLAGDTAGGGGSRRTLSRADERQSRSSSVDPLARDPPARSTIVRAPSGKDLFKGREVLRRTVSLARGGPGARDESQSQSQGQSQRSFGMGLMGRSLARSASASAAAAKASAAAAETLILATPAKQRHHAAAPHRRAMHHPTPIREEPSSSERSHAAYVAETPVAPSRVLAAFVAETPFRPRPALVAETPLHTIPQDDDDLADLMVPTDEEASGDGDGDSDEEASRPMLGQPFALETPRR